jgi:hypothetical protein
MAGHLEVLKWARENGCPWDYRVCTHAAANGQLTVLKWAIENGCEWYPHICEYAAEQNKQTETLKWIRDFEKNGYKNL